MNRIHRLSETISHLFFPNRCAYCREVLPKDVLVCAKCEKKLKPITVPCQLCAHAQGDCICKKKAREFNGVVAPFYYEDLTKTAVKNLKFFEQGYVVTEMATRIVATVQQNYRCSFDYVIGVPLSKKRERARGYNQSDLLAKEVARQLNVPFNDKILVKAFDNAPQHELSGHLRSGNVVGVYDVVLPAQIDGKQILLIDDVFTTGATLNECAKVMKIYGATTVYCASFAVTKGKEFSRKG